MVSVVPESSDDARQILLQVRVGMGPLSQPAAKAAAKEIAKRIPVKGTTTHSGTVIIPMEKYVAGVSVLLTEEELHIKIRTKAASSNG